MSDQVIKVENLSKQYRLGTVGTGSFAHDVNRIWYRVRGKEDPYLRIGEVNQRDKASDSEYVWALTEVNFEVNQGDVLGIIGRNGAGKSTLLKILSRTTAPTKGSIKIKGRIASLLEVGTGFHPELTGRENIFLNGAILGMTKKEIRSKFDEIVDFAGVERYIDTPVKRYSSGMYVRLAFGVAAHLEPEILVVDEVLAVGDAEFQKKALGKMKDVSSNQGRTVLFVSHNMSAIENLCTRAVLMANGRLVADDTVNSIIQRYLALSNTRTGDFELSNKKRTGTGEIQFTRVELLEAIAEQNVNELKTGMPYIFRLHTRGSFSSANINIGIGIQDRYDQRIALLSNEILGQTVKLTEEKPWIDFLIPELPLVEAQYSLTIFLSVNGLISDWIADCFAFNVLSGDYYKTGKNVPPGNGNILFKYSIIN